MVTKEKEKKFCRDCGVELVKYKTGRYDEYTGKEIMGKRCENLGHVFLFLSDRCKRCGYVAWGGF